MGTGGSFKRGATPPQPLHAPKPTPVGGSSRCSDNSITARSVLLGVGLKEPKSFFFWLRTVSKDRAQGHSPPLPGPTWAIFVPMLGTPEKAGVV